MPLFDEDSSQRIQIERSRGLRNCCVMVEDQRVARQKNLAQPPSLNSFDAFDDTNDLGSPTKFDAGRRRGCRYCSSVPQDPLLLLTVLGVILGLILGSLLRLADLSPWTIELIGFPGNIMLRLLKMIVLPLVSLSMISGLCSLRENGSGQGVQKLTQLTAAYYIACTSIAIFIGLVLVLIIRPGQTKIARANGNAGCAASIVVETQTGSGSEEEPRGAMQALIQVAYMIAPDNIAEAAVDMNVLGIITFSLMFGWAISSLGSRANPVIEMIYVINDAIGKMVTAILWISPLGVASLIASSVLSACDVGDTARALALWIVAVVLGLSAFGFLVLPAALFAFTGRSPMKVIKAFTQPLALAIGTSSSAGALPVAMSAAREMGLSDSIVSFFLPLGIAVNLSGTALYEAVTAIWIAQAHDVPLGAGGMIVIAVTSSLAAVGAPAIPSAGLVTMMVVLQAAGLGEYAGDLAVVMATDWLLDRFRTGVNLLGDIVGCVIVSDLVAGKSNQQRPSGFQYSHIEMGHA